MNVNTQHDMIRQQQDIEVARVARSLPAVDLAAQVRRTRNLVLIMDDADGMDVWVALLFAGLKQEAQEMYDLAFGALNLSTSIYAAGRVDLGGLSCAVETDDPLWMHLERLIERHPGEVDLTSLLRLRQAMRDLHARCRGAIHRGGVNIEQSLSGAGAGAGTMRRDVH